MNPLTWSDDRQKAERVIPWLVERKLDRDVRQERKKRHRYVEGWRSLLAARDFGGWNMMATVAQRVRQRLLSKVGRAIPFTTEELLGCRLEDMMRHLESQFPAHFTWGNYGTVWAVDHRVPLVAFNLSRTDEVLRAGHFTNLQPLSRRMNSIKSGDIVPYAPKTDDMPMSSFRSVTSVGVRGAKKLRLLRLLCDNQS